MSMNKLFMTQTWFMPELAQAKPFGMGMGRLYKSEGGAPWEYTNVWGATLYLEAKNELKEKYIKMINMETGKMVWEYEVVKNTQAKVLAPNFLSIEGETDGQLWGISFVEDKVGVDNFTAKVIETSSGVVAVKKSPKPTKKKEKKGWFAKKIHGLFKGKESSSPQAPQEIKISAPSNFKRAAHMGLENGGGFKFENIPSEWQSFFLEAGYTKEELKDEKLTKKLVKKMKKFEKKKAKKSKPPPPPPSSTPPGPPSSSSSSGIPPPPPPPPPALGGPSFSSTSGIPPPPPPPPAGGLPKKKAPVRRTPPSAGSPSAASPSSPSNNSGAGRGDLLAAIRAGKQLRKTEGPKKKITLDINNKETRNDLMSVLNRKMAARKNALDDSSDEESSESDLSSDDDF